MLIGQFRKIVEAGEPGKVTTQEAKNSVQMVRGGVGRLDARVAESTDPTRKVYSPPFSGVDK